MLSNLAIPLVILTGLGVLLALIIVLAAFVRGRATGGFVGILLICAFFAAVFLFMRPGRRSSIHVGPWAPGVTVKTWADGAHGHDVEAKVAEFEAESRRIAEAAFERARDVRDTGESIALRYLEPPPPADASAPPAPTTTAAPAPPEDPAVVRAQLKDAVKNRVTRVKQRMREPGWKGWLGTGLTALAIMAFLFVGYIFLDASTRGQFTWSLRILSAVAFGLIFAAAAIMRH